STHTYFTYSTLFRSHVEVAHFEAVADDIARDGQHGDQNALVHNVNAEAAGEDAVGRFARRTVHDVLFGLFHTEGKGREAVGNQVDKEQVDRVEQREAEQRGKKDAEHLAHVGGEQELDGLADVVID